MELHNLSYTKGSRNHKRRICGRGFSSGLGKTCSRGQKGQHSRKSGNVRIGFEGGQTPIYRKIPKIGFSNYNFADKAYVVSLQQIINSKLTDVNRKTLIAKKLIGKEKLPIKLIGPSSYKNIKITKLNIEVEKATKSVLKFLTENGANINLIKINK